MEIYRSSVEKISHHNHIHNHVHERHRHKLDMARTSRAFAIGIALNIVFVAIEVATGFVTGSLALLTDAGHNLADVASLVIALLALKLATAKPSAQYTYGYKKATILAALVNAVILLAAVGGIVYEAVGRVFNPVPVEGGVVAVVAGVGIAINAVTALLFFRDKDKDLNVKGAYLHLVADALVSVGVVVAGVVMAFTAWYWLDSVISIAVAVIIFVGTWSLLKNAVRLSLDGVPQNISVSDVTKKILSIQGIMDIHHLHIWGLSTTQAALTCHVVLHDDASLTEISRIKAGVRAGVKQLGIEHSTIEVESNLEECGDKETDSCSRQ
ncbi:MAG: cation diffusion facilitator family transporter [Prevotellaceae bacterium]|jgi:cobalt-zinc-cadmium efflux system protein|nr:cation diffusion facilitator family transporter [Prevotellaceae bacterium]